MFLFKSVLMSVKWAYDRVGFIFSISHSKFIIPLFLFLNRMTLDTLAEKLQPEICLSCSNLDMKLRDNLARFVLKKNGLRHFTTPILYVDYTNFFL